VEIREIRAGELETLVTIAKAAQPREFATVSGFVDWREQAADMVWLVAENGGSARGAAYALTGWHTPQHRAIGAVLVAPELRGAGSGDRLLAAIVAWVAERGVTELEGPLQEDDEGSLEWARRRGYVEAGRNSRLVLDLAEVDAPEPDPPAGIEIVPWAERLGLAQGIYEVALEAVPDIPGEEEDDIGTLEEWLARDMQGESDDPNAVFVALERDVVVGYAKLSLSPDEPDRAFHDLTGVRRSHRGRGIAAALKRTQIAWAKRAGYHALQTSNEVRNEPIRRLNEKHGYVLEPGVVIVRRAL
jgi:GNAT superfamily N-acetyltransferase